MKIRQNVQICQADLALMNLTKIHQIINPAKPIFLWQIWLKFAKIKKFTNIHLVWQKFVKSAIFVRVFLDMSVGYTYIQRENSLTHLGRQLRQHYHGSIPCFKKVTVLLTRWVNSWRNQELTHLVLQTTRISAEQYNS